MQDTTDPHAEAGARTGPRLGRVLDFLRELWALDHQLQALSKRMHREIGVTGPQRLTLRIAGRRPDLTAGELAHALSIHPSTLTGILKRLEGRGLIERRADAADARRCRLKLTATGAAQARPDQKGTLESAVRRALDGTADEDIETTCRLLRALAAEIARTGVGKTPSVRRSRPPLERPPRGEGRPPRVRRTARGPSSE